MDSQIQSVQRFQISSIPCCERHLERAAPPRRPDLFFHRLHFDWEAERCLIPEVRGRQTTRRPGCQCGTSFARCSPSLFHQSHFDWEIQRFPRCWVWTFILPAALCLGTKVSCLAAGRRQHLRRQLFFTDHTLTGANQLVQVGPCQVECQKKCALGSEIQFFGFAREHCASPTLAQGEDSQAGDHLKCRTLSMTTSKPRCRAVAPIKRSWKAMLMPWAICSPSIRPASCAISTLTGCTIMSR